MKNSPIAFSLFKPNLVSVGVSQATSSVAYKDASKVGMPQRSVYSKRSGGHMLPWLTGSAIFLAAMNVFAMDTGDAPASYGIALHNIPSQPPRLGLLSPDDDTSGINGSDDATGLDDEDGVFAFPELTQNTKSYTTNVFASNPTSQVANLVGWVDFDGDGVFSSDEFAVAAVPPGADNERFKLTWPDLSGVSSEFTGQTFSRFRITTDLITAFDSTGTFDDGEVEDYALFVLADADGDDISDISDPDDDNDSIPDSVEGFNIDTDGDGLVDALDVDSDNDLVPDLFEAGSNPSSPQDTDGDGVPDFLDLDSNGDGVPDSLLITSDLDNDGIIGDVEGIGDADGDGVINSFDIDSDNDGIADVIETIADSDGDGVPNFLDLDSDNDGVSDFLESSHALVDTQSFDTDGDGRIDPTNIHGENGLVDAIETVPDGRVTRFVLADSDADGVPDFLDLDSDNDGVQDIVEFGGVDLDNNSQVDALIDSNNNGIIDSADVANNPGGIDSDADGIVDSADSDFSTEDDIDLDGIANAADPDVDGNGLIDIAVNTASTGGLTPDSDGDGIPDFQDSLVGLNPDDTNGNGPNAGVDFSGIGSAVNLDGNASSVSVTTTTSTTGPVGSLQTGINGLGAGGGGCTLSRSSSGAIDPLLALLALFSSAMLFFNRRRKMHVRD